MQGDKQLSTSLFTLHLAQTYDFQTQIKKQCKINLPQARIMLDLAWVDGMSTTRAICSRCEMNPSNVATALSSLERDGYVTRSECSDDRRIICVSVTEAGKDLIEKIDEVLSSCITNWWRPLGIESQNFLTDCCLKIVQKVQEELRITNGEISFDTVYLASIFRCNIELDRALAAEKLKQNEFRILEVIYDKEDGLLSGSISSLLLMRLSTVTRTVDALVARKLAVRTRDREDRRATRVAITDEGRELVERIIPALNNVYFQELLPMEEEAQAMYLACAKHIVETMRHTFAPIS